jgi:predicted permease
MNLTVLFIVVGVACIAIFDVYIIRKKGKQESISAHIIRGSKKYPLLVLITGIVLGHLFWSMPTEDVQYNTECVEKVDGN